jgi:RNA polymerase sigma-70 factor, ECF subfamily
VHAVSVEQIFRSEWGRVVAGLIGYLGDFDLAEEAAQEAFALAAERWPRDGVPASPRAWLMTTARNRAIDRIRRDRTLAEKTRLLEVREAIDDEVDETTIPDERLELVFTCCHPALVLDAQVALTLRALGGLSTDEIARAFLVPEPTMAKRLVRAKSKIRAAGIPFRVPPAHLLPDRLAAVLAVVYLIFNEGYSSHPPRGELAAEAIRLGSALAELMPGEPEVHGLLALMLLNDARRDARFAGGTVVLLHEQDRSLWDFAQIDQGCAALDRALALGGRDNYVLQAAIAALHADEAPDWPQIAALYGELARLTGSPVVELNRAVAIAEAGDVAGALELVERLELDRYHYLHAARADLLRRLGRFEEARAAYNRALELVHSDAERRFLAARRAQLVTLRPATAADVERVTELVQAAYGRYVERLGRRPRPMLDDYAAVVRDNDVTVAERDGAIAGFVVLAVTDEGFVVDNVAVDPAFQGSGVGRALLEHAEREARRAGFDSIYLYTHELMTENQGLYARIGYVEYDRRDPVVYMRKPLPRDETAR